MMRITSVGVSLEKVAPGLTGQALRETLAVDMPSTVSFASWADACASVGVAARFTLIGTDIRLRGEAVVVGESLIFAVALVVDSPDRLVEFNLILSDFAAHDAGPDVMLMEKVHVQRQTVLRDTVQDLTKVLETNDRLRQVESALASDFRIAAEIKLRIDQDNQIIEFSHGMSYVDGVTSQDLVGERLRAVLPGLATAVEQARDASSEDHHATVVRIESTGPDVWMDTRIATFPDGSALIVGRDITDERGQQELLKHRAHHDPLTGLGNRRLFWEQVEESLKSNKGGLLAVMLIDLDGFKAINDRFGHGAGDNVLRAAAERLQGCVRGQDTVARLGGDEFGVLLHAPPSITVVGQIAQRIVERLAERIDTDGYVVSVSATVGIVVADADSDVDSLVRDADLAMYNARADNESQIGWFATRMREAVNESRRLTDDLVAALAADELSVEYQPILELQSRRLIGFEALARWTHPVRGPISPEVFIPLAEQARHIGELDRVVMRKAIGQLAAWREITEQPIRMAMNVSPLSLTTTLGSELQALALQEDVELTSLLVEVTESSLLTDLELAEEVLGDLAGRGIKVALDDFGTGYSSLTHLYRLPIGLVKIDRSFVADVASGERQARKLVEAAIAMSVATEADVVAEGVETQAQVDALLALGCHFGQGYFFAKPLGPAAAAVYLRESTWSTRLMAT